MKSLGKARLCESSDKVIRYVIRPFGQDVGTKMVNKLSSKTVAREERNGACAHYVMVSKFQWKPFWLATQRDPQSD